MKFDKSFRGYDVAQVDSYVATQQQHFEQVTAAQKQRIFELSDQNEQLKSQLLQYQLDEKAIKESLIESNKLALQLKNDAEKYSRVVLQRAKVFYATWQAYAKTMLNGFTVQEMEQFNQMLKKVEQLMQNYGDTGTQPSQQQPDLANPVQKVEQATQHAIDLTELLKPDQSLEEMCNDLGLL